MGDRFYDQRVSQTTGSVPYRKPCCFVRAHRHKTMEALNDLLILDFSSLLIVKWYREITITNGEESEGAEAVGHGVGRGLARWIESSWFAIFDDKTRITPRCYRNSIDIHASLSKQEHFDPKMGDCSIKERIRTPPVSTKLSQYLNRSMEILDNQSFEILNTKTMLQFSPKGIVAFLRERLIPVGCGPSSHGACWRPSLTSSPNDSTQSNNNNNKWSILSNNKWTIWIGKRFQQQMVHSHRSVALQWHGDGDGADDDIAGRAIARRRHASVECFVPAVWHVPSSTSCTAYYPSSSSCSPSSSSSSS